MKRSSAFILSLGLVAAAPAVTTLLGAAGAVLSFVGAVTPAWAAEDISFDNLTFNFGPASFKIPHIAINGSSLSKSDMENLVKGPWGAPSVDTLAKFDASAIVIPEIDFTLTAPVAGKDTPLTETGAYRDVHIDNVKAGKAGHIGVGTMNVDVKGPQTVSYTMGPLSATDYDFAAVARIAFTKAQPGEPLKQIAGPASIENLVFNGPNGVEAKIAHTQIGATSMRPLANESMADFVQFAIQHAATKDADKSPDKALTAKMVGMVADLYDAFATEGMTMSDITIKSSEPDFHGASVKSVKIGPIANSRFEEFGIEGIDIDSAAARVKLDRFAFLGVDMKPMLSLFSEMAKSGDMTDEAMAKVDWRKAMPHLDGIDVKGVDISVLKGPQPQWAKLAGYELKLGNYVGAIPTSIRTEIDQLTSDVDLLKDSAQMMRALGYVNFNLSSVADLAWVENNKSIIVNEISAKGDNMGSVSLKGSFGNVPRELFTGSPAQMQVAGLGITLSDATLRLENNGLFDKIVALSAKSQNTTPDKIRSLWGTQAALGIPQLLGGSAGAKALGNAVASFIAQPKTLLISVKAKDKGGLGISDFAGAGGTPNPAAIFDKLEVTASANK